MEPGQGVFDLAEDPLVSTQVLFYLLCPTGMGIIICTSSRFLTGKQKTQGGFHSFVAKVHDCHDGDIVKPAVWRIYKQPGPVSLQDYPKLPPQPFASDNDFALWAQNEPNPKEPWTNLLLVFYWLIEQCECR